MNRQEPDVGTQYRSAIFYHDAEQWEEARASKAVLEKEHVFKRPIVTEITPASEFYRCPRDRQLQTADRDAGNGRGEPRQNQRADSCVQTRQRSAALQDGGCRTSVRAKVECEVLWVRWTFG